MFDQYWVVLQMMALPIGFLVSFAVFWRLLVEPPTSQSTSPWSRIRDLEAKVAWLEEKLYRARRDKGVYLYPDEIAAERAMVLKMDFNWPPRKT